MYRPGSCLSKTQTLPQGFPGFQMGDSRRLRYSGRCSHLPANAPFSLPCPHSADSSRSCLATVRLRKVVPCRDRSSVLDGPTWWVFCCCQLCWVRSPPARCLMRLRRAPSALTAHPRLRSQFLPTEPCLSHTQSQPCNRMVNPLATCRTRPFTMTWGAEPASTRSTAPRQSQAAGPSPEM